MVGNDAKGSPKITFGKKRKRNWASQGSAYGDNLLILDDFKTKTGSKGPNDNQEYTLNESKVINSLSKFVSKSNIKSISQQSQLKIILSISEAALFLQDNESLLKRMQDSFGISGWDISPLHLGSIEKALYLYGEVGSIAKAAVFVAYILKVKLNNYIPAESYTLKSPNYHLSVLMKGPSDDDTLQKVVQSQADYCMLRDVDTTYPFGYNNHSDQLLITIKGDFSSLYNFLLFLLDYFIFSLHSNTLDENEYTPVQIITAHDNAALYHIQEANEGKVSKSLNILLDHAYSKQHAISTIANEVEGDPQMLQ
ncbi:Piso0_003289 [Millerozyma farinosa CBS 7064]|uniref:Piso0_003289 protein n=1 Tax=Pichia sorbitophila (strain ATCC MYA-4447 / BCRC 22081 / CBS 7064 / NBRC 10061 / NRRL Y-12695) TaxID=559304 RepID=G8YIP2_PICSO|nr:Piso0_003289 [Millerozyma farinosa CBS 7064]CCE80952.1 Piso0_003289 [Millerozyma farinosa CBS 7064]